ncbi:threonine-phosphate decarboxylase CobD [Chitinasiproducens palmae]|uniref:threonine-phosphate decarboxylase n=1 Tax=Chitinasiproducens palmae TaxID=1770053 RepID=A0A1H2PRX7_9BURK|nr:threonine-phosphate decarboxylase CobD [Chitinasiproducens palmae]SDV49691.1 L-threonine O-3-phosphate decarboxylase [Chitinasiproducens palmae]
MLEHGGRLRRAAQHYGIPLPDWLDLSTGIAPWVYPLPQIDTRHWQRLPEDDDGLVEAACAAYGAPHVLPLPGSQAAIQALPTLFTPQPIAVLAPSYAEHAHQWQRAGHTLAPFSDAAGLAQRMASCNIVVMVQPNNPTGWHLGRDALRQVAAELAGRDGLLVVDEAFIDADPALSLAPFSASRGLLVLRSLGKFYGLAGARVGFACGEPILLARLREAIGPWPVNGPARWVATAALRDATWQRNNGQRLRQASQRLAMLLRAHGLTPDGGTPLFQWLRHPQAQAIHAALARRGVLTRCYADPASLRFGLPGASPFVSEPCSGDAANADARAWQRLADALAQLRDAHLC